MYFSKATLALLLPVFLSLTTLAAPVAESNTLEARAHSHHKHPHHHHHASMKTSSAAPAPTVTSSSAAPAATTSSGQESLQQFEDTHDSSNPEDEQTAGYMYDEQQGQGV